MFILCKEKINEKNLFFGATLLLLILSGCFLSNESLVNSMNEIYSDESIELSVGDQIEFITAPFHFYDGYHLPIVGLKKGDDTLLTFEDGKQNLLYWMNYEFK